MMDVLAAFAVFKAYRAAANNAANALVILQAHAKIQILLISSLQGFWSCRKSN